MIMVFIIYYRLLVSSLTFAWALPILLLPRPPVMPLCCQSSWTVFTSSSLCAFERCLLCLLEVLHSHSHLPRPLLSGGSSSIGSSSLPDLTLPDFKENISDSLPFFPVVKYINPDDFHCLVAHPPGLGSLFDFPI